MFGLSADELRIFSSLSTPHKIQDFLDALPINHEKSGETCFSPRKVLREQKAHCLEGALLAGVALWLHGELPLVTTLTTMRGDDDHALTLFRMNGHWGALSKTNHGILRYRDPIFPSLHALVLSYFNEYFLSKTGKKTLRAYTKPISLKRFGTKWITAEEDVWAIADSIARHTRIPLVSKETIPHLRHASTIERTSVEVVEWEKSDPRT